MNSITAKYFSTDFFIANKIDAFAYIILEYLYSWILSDNPPESFKTGYKRYFYVSQSHISNDMTGILSQQVISSKMSKLKECGIICETYLLKEKGKLNKFYICFDWGRVMQSLAPQAVLKQQKYKFCSNWFEKIFKFIEEEKESIGNDKIPNGLTPEEKLQFLFNEQNQADSYNNTEENKMPELLDEEDINVKKKYKYSNQADSIAKRILFKHADLFFTKFPKEGQEPTKTYICLCQKIDDIYNGHFVSSRFYAFDDNVFNNKQFDTEGWREKINDVKGDWSKAKALIFNAVENFVLMYEEDRMPFKKDYLTNNLNDWFFSDTPNSKGQSQFIQSLNEPQIQKEKLGTDKAKNIVENLKKKSSISYHSGHELNKLLPVSANELTAWQFITDIIKWGKLLWQFDENAKYFMQCKINGELQAGPKVLPALFARYLKENKISVSLSTLNIQQAVDINGPWRWFIEEACRKHDMNMNFVQCFNDTDFYDARKMSGKIAFDNTNEIPVF